MAKPNLCTDPQALDVTVSNEPIKDLKTNVKYFGDFAAIQQTQRWREAHCIKCAQCSLRVMCRFPLRFLVHCVSIPLEFFERWIL